MTGVQPRRTGTGYKAVAQGQSSIGSRSPYSFGLHSGKSGGAWAKNTTTYPGRSARPSEGTTASATTRESGAEVSRGRSSSPGPNARGRIPRGATSPPSRWAKGRIFWRKAVTPQLDGRAEATDKTERPGNARKANPGGTEPRLRRRGGSPTFRVRGVAVVHGEGATTGLELLPPRGVQEPPAADGRVDSPQAPLPASQAA